jgi:hypothetical protein
MGRGDRKRRPFSPGAGRRYLTSIHSRSLAAFGLFELVRCLNFQTTFVAISPQQFWPKFRGLNFPMTLVAISPEHFWPKLSCLNSQITFVAISQVTFKGVFDPSLAGRVSV